MAYNTIASLDKLTCTNYETLEENKTDLVEFLGPEMTPTTWISGLKRSKDTTT